LTDGRFSGVSTGACIGHISPEALAGGPIGKVRDGDRIEIIVDRKTLAGSVQLLGDAEKIFGADEGTPVTEAYKVPFKFTGKINAVTIELKETNKKNNDDAAQAEGDAQLKKGLSD